MAWMNVHRAIGKIPRLLWPGEFAFDFGGMPVVCQRLSWHQRWNLLVLGLYMMRRGERNLALPPIIQIEPTNVCNLRCPLCPSGNRTMARAAGFMEMSVFRQVLDELEGSLLAVMLYSWGEPLLHPQFAEMVKICSERRLVSMTSTNGNALSTLDQALALVDAGLGYLVVAIDGSTQELYGKYRHGGNLEAAKQCLRLVEQAKAIRRSAYPYTNFRAVVGSHNENDIAELEKLARGLGANMFSCKTIGSLIDSPRFGSYVADQEKHRRFYSGHQADVDSPQPPCCPFPFRQPTVFWDGTVVACEFDYHLSRPLGKIGKSSLRGMWNGRHAMARRAALRRGVKEGFCQHCPYRQSTDDNKNILFSLELRPAVAQ